MIVGGFLLALLSVALSRIIMVQELFRHGARYPIYSTMDNYSIYAKQDKVEGELTKQGKRMHYLLGRIIARQYFDSLGLSEVLNSSYVFVKSTDVNRTIESVQSHLAGMLETLQNLQLDDTQAKMAIPDWNDSDDPIKSQGGPVFINAEKYKPLAIHSQLGGANNMTEGDFLRNYSPDTCFNQKGWSEENQKTTWYKDIEAHGRVKQAIQAFADHYPNKTINIATIAQYFDNYECNKFNSRGYDPIFEGQYAKQYYMMYVLDLYVNLFYTQLQINATATPFLNKTLQNMRTIMRDQNRQRLIIYSAHDTTVGNILAALRLTSAQCVWDNYVNGFADNCVTDYPIYTSNLIFELHDRESDSYVVKVRYNGGYMRLPFCNYSTECTYQQFETFANKTMREDYRVDCGVVSMPEETTNPYVLGLVIALSVLGILLIAAVVYMCITRHRQKKSEGSSTLLAERTESQVL